MRRAQNINKVLGTKCNPTTEEEMVLLNEKKKLARSAFERALLNYQGKFTVRSPQDDCDDQVAYKICSIAARSQLDQN